MLFGLNCLVVVFCIFMFFKLLFDPHQPKSEAFTMLSGGCILAGGVYVAYQNGYLTTDFKGGLITLGIAMLIAMVWVIIRWLFNPLSW